MSLPITGQAQGLIQSTSQKSGSPAAFSAGWNNEFVISELEARYAALVKSGVVFSLNFPAAAFAAPSATALGAFALWNPAGSGKNIHLMDIQVALSTWTLVTTTTAVIAVIFIPNQTPTSVGQSGIAIRNNLVGGATQSVAAGYVSGTVAGAPVLGNRVVATFVLATAVGFGNLSAEDIVDGKVIIAPGSGIQIQAVSGTEADISGIVGLTWAELPA